MRAGAAEEQDHAAIRTFARADLGQLEWDTSIVEQAHAARLGANA